MIKVSAAKLSSNLFEFLDQVNRGETITIQKNGKEVALLIPIKQEDWRQKIRVKPTLTVPQDKAFAPLEDVWEDK